ncbi:MAG: hypothetical protein EOP09_10560, partial [Proteobacteria bacterium]
MNLHFGLRYSLLTVLLIGASVFAMTTTSFADTLQPNTECLESIRGHFLSKNGEAAQKFFKLQSQITLHRLGWAYLDSLEKSGFAERNQLIPVEQSILKDLEKFETESSDPDFKQAHEQFLNAPLSRKSLSRTLQALQQLTLAQGQSAHSAYIMDLNDIK